MLGDGARSDATLPPDVELEPEDDATIFYTSGTTGRPKGALGTHRNICDEPDVARVRGARARPGRAARRRRRARRPDAPGRARTLLSVPFFHATGCHSVLVANLASGGKLVLMHKWDPERALELIERERITTFGGVPAMVWQVLQSPDFEKRDISQRDGRSATAARRPPPELVRAHRASCSRARTPSNGYGLTETSSVDDDQLRRRLPAQARQRRRCPSPVVRREARRRGGDDLPTGEVGELWIKGPNVVKGYWNKPEATAAAFADGWLHSGDLARVDDEGFVYIVDRAKDMVIRGGENVYCAEVEAALFEHPAVADAAVIGVPHQVLGEEVGAVVQLSPGAPPPPRSCRPTSASASPPSRCRPRSGSGTSRCPATPPARSSSATCARSSASSTPPPEPLSVTNAPHIDHP